MGKPTDKQSSSRKILLLYIFQLLSVVFIIYICLYFNKSFVVLRSRIDACRRRTIELKTASNINGSIDQWDPSQRFHHLIDGYRKSHLKSKQHSRRDLRTNRREPFAAQDDYVRLGSYGRIQKVALNEICTKIHINCADKGKKVRGSSGAKGPPGPLGPVGLTGPRGATGMAGARGLTGPRGKPGIDGRDGMCNCSFPDVIVQRVPIVVSGPPKIQYYPVTVAVPGPPIIIYKEITRYRGDVSPIVVTKLMPGPTKMIVQNVTYVVTESYDVNMTRDDVNDTYEPHLTPPPDGGEIAGRPKDFSPIFVRRRSTSKPEGVNRTVGPSEHAAGQEITEESTGPTVVPLGPPDLEYSSDTSTVAQSTKSATSTSTTPTTTEAYTGPPTLGRNKRRCTLELVGRPIYHADSPFSAVGAWMRDAMPMTGEMEAKRWVTDGYASPVLYEYKDEQDLIKKKQLIKYYMNYLVVGTGAVLYNGSFYYHRYNSPDIVRYDLYAAEENITKIEDMAYVDCQRKEGNDGTDDNFGFTKCNSSDRQAYLYGIPHNYADFAVDENGLWLVYLSDQIEDNDTLKVIKLEAYSMEIVAQWNITAANVSTLANTFIMCGVLYGLRSGTDSMSQIDFAYDLYENREVAVSVVWRNPYKHNTMLDYIPYDRRIYFYDNQTLLSTSVGVK